MNEKCKYCEVPEEKIKRTIFYSNITPDVYLCNNNGAYRLTVDIPYEEFSFDINYCPMCGRKLNEVAE